MAGEKQMELVHSHQEGVIYTCPMHPEIRQSRPGSCPKCGMALEAVAVGGRIVQVAMGRLEATINTRTLILKAAELVGSVGGNTDDIKAVYALFASGDLDPLITTISFEEIGEGLGRLARGEIKGRLVARLY